MATKLRLLQEQLSWRLRRRLSRWRAKRMARGTADKWSARVARVVDGDTFDTVAGDRVRLAGVDAPEAGQPGSADAVERLRDLVEGKMVVITEVGPMSQASWVSDVKLKEDGTSVNKAMRELLQEA